MRSPWQRRQLVVVPDFVMTLVYKKSPCTNKPLGYDVRMESIPDTMAISEARANLTDVVNAVHLQDRAVLLHRRGKPQALVVPPDFADLIEALGGLDNARGVMKEALEVTGP